MATAWNTLAPTYDDHRARDPIYHACIRAACRALAPRSGERILDAGCGTGLTIRSYWRPGLRVTGLDFSAASLNRARSLCPAAVQLIQGDVTRLPFPTGHFDQVLCANTLQHLNSRGRANAATELARATKRGGRVVITVHAFSLSKQRAGWIKEGKPGQAGIEYIYRFEPDELWSLLSPVLADLRIRGIGLPLPYRWKLGPLSRFVEPLLSRCPGSDRRGHMLLACGTVR